LATAPTSRATRATLMLNLFMMSFSYFPLMTNASMNQQIRLNGKKTDRRLLCVLEYWWTFSFCFSATLIQVNAALPDITLRAAANVVLHMQADVRHVRSESPDLQDISGIVHC
jgi:hypothetical protein